MKNYLQNSLSLVLIIIPCQNEEKYIGKCLDTVIKQDFQKGMSQFNKKINK